MAKGIGFFLELIQLPKQALLKDLQLDSNTYDLEGGYSRRWIRPITTKTEGRNKNTQSLRNIKHESLDGTVSTSTKLNINKLETSEFQRIEYCDVQQQLADNRDLASLATVIVFDIETTGLSRENERIIEIALQDLLGGENSTFQTLVNPERYVPNSHVHGITTHMVNRPDVPRMVDLIPILLQYVSSRQKPGGYVVWVAHNARCFDVPFLIKEFGRCSIEVPPDWLFVDTLPLARELMKSGSKLSSGVSLQALRQYYEIPLVGSAHRAMSDVNILSLILQRMTFDLKLPVSSLIERSFKASDLINLKKKKNSS
ncbi:hypothetical protein L1049_019482 [Liquidambar formosana]|uniref:Exonuclease domain-containing protein n=1 Tax=Liquidambar formosana TaxID=63359 RepID=A0AAP0X324_LIQFO